jgi:hypothetical protein
MDGTRGTGEIEDPVDFKEDRLRDVVPHEFEGGAVEEMGDVPLSAREEIVEADYLVTVADEPVAQVGTDKPGASGDENALRLRIGMVVIHKTLAVKTVPFLKRVMLPINPGDDAKRAMTLLYAKKTGVSPFEDPT